MIGRLVQSKSRTLAFYRFRKSPNRLLKYSLLSENSFHAKHIGIKQDEQAFMLRSVGFESSDAFLTSIYQGRNLLSAKADSRDYRERAIEPDGLSEYEVQQNFMNLVNLEPSSQRCFYGQGFYSSVMPNIVKRAILENPRWYTAYTPYQSEISQGRLEMLYHFQQMIISLTGLPIANASLLDEASAAAEAMLMSFRHRYQNENKIFYVDNSIHPHIYAVLKGRADNLDIKIEFISIQDCVLSQKFPDMNQVFGIYYQYPNTFGELPSDFETFKEWISSMKHKSKFSLIMGTDPLALCVLPSPGYLGTDIAVGSTQRFGLPLGNGGPHAGYFACTYPYIRKIPGRLVGKQINQYGQDVYRLSLQTREQHIRRDKATSNICTAQALPASLSAAFAIYHGPKKLQKISRRINDLLYYFINLLKSLNLKDLEIPNGPLYGTVSLKTPNLKELCLILEYKSIYVRSYGSSITISFDEITTLNDIQDLISAFKETHSQLDKPMARHSHVLPAERTDEILTNPVFNSFHSEVQLTRFLYQLAEKDYSLVDGMIPLGSCTMKLNAVTELLPLSLDKLVNQHPFLPSKAYQELNKQFKKMILELTGMESVTLQPNSGAQGEFCGVSIIKAYFKSKNQNHKRTRCIIPVTAHGTNPATAFLCGYEILSVKGLSSGHLDLEHLSCLIEKFKDSIAFVMLTIPSTFGLFESQIIDLKLFNLLKSHDIQIYLDGANMNAFVGYLKPGHNSETGGFGADVMHINLHKTFCIPHGGGGPGMAPVACKKHLAPFLPNDLSIPLAINNSSLMKCSNETRNETFINDKAIEWVTGSPNGSNCLIAVSYAYIQLMGLNGLKKATFTALLSANFVKMKLEPFYNIQYTQVPYESNSSVQNKLCAHEFILSVCPETLKSLSSPAALISKRLMNYGIHSPTLSWPVNDSLMIEVTESEPYSELTRLCDAFICIFYEFTEYPNILQRAPWTFQDVMSLLIKNQRTINTSQNTASHLDNLEKKVSQDYKLDTKENKYEKLDLYDQIELCLNPWLFHYKNGRIQTLYRSYSFTRIVPKIDDALGDTLKLQECSSCI